MIEVPIASLLGIGAVVVTGLLFAISFILWLHEHNIHFLRPLKEFIRRPWFDAALLLFFVGGMVQYGSTKGFLGASPMLMYSPMASVDLPTVTDGSGEMSDSLFPAYTNTVTNLCFTGILPASTSVFLRATWPADTTLPGNALEIYARHDLTTNGWEGIGTASVSAADESVIVELPHAYLPGGWTNAMFFVFGLCTDTDGDGLSDSFEHLVSHSCPSAADSDSDGDPDGWEIAYGFDPTDATPQIAPIYASVTNASQDISFGFHDMTVTASSGSIPSLSAASAGTMLLSSSDICRDGLPQLPQNGRGDPNNEFSFSMSGYFTPPVSGTYEFVVSADDHVCLTVGAVSVSASWESDGDAERSASGHFKCGIAYPVMISYDNSGAYRYRLDCGYRLVSSDDEDVPCLQVDPSTIKFSIQAGSDLSAFAPDVSLVGTFDSASDYSVSVEAGPGLVVERGSGIADVRVYPDAAYALWDDGVESLATFNLVKDGEIIDTKTCLFICEAVKEDDSSCKCNEGTVTENGCVSFSQKFGSSPDYPEIPAGRVVVTAARPSSALYTTAALRYDHPMMRRIRYLRNLDARIVDGLGRAVEYVRGLPSGVSSGADGQLFRDESGNIVEELPDGLRVIYDASGCVAALQTEFSAPIPVSALGITVNRAADGSIASIVSASDGTMSATATGVRSWRLYWTTPSGTQVKHFDFGGDGSTTFTLREYRNENYQFDSTWTYDAALHDFSFEKGAIRSRKSIAYDSTTRDWTSVLSYLDANGDAITSSSVTLNRDGHAICATSRRDAITGRELHSSSLDADGRIAIETDTLGACTLYRYDAYGRVIRKTVLASGLPTNTVTYTYTAATEPMDFRPVSVRTYLDGVLSLEEDFEYGMTADGNRFSFRTRTSGGVTRTSYDEYDANGRKVLAVSEDGRATRTAYAASDTGGTVESVDEGILSNVNSAFVLVDGKSTRTIRYIDSAGNAIRVEHYALVSGEWRELSWETHAYNATHKVTASTYSDGTTDAADWICTGPTFRADRSGVTVSNEYDSAKRLAASTRYAPFGAVRTEYVHDGEGHVVGETTSAANCETQTVSRVYDSRGRIVRETDAHGRTTTTAYSADDRTNTVTYADGGTRVTTLNADGSIAFVTGTAVTPEFHTYGVTDDGHCWECVRYGRSDSPRYETTYRNGFGETLRIERSGFGGATLVTENEYDAQGRLVSTTETAKPTVTNAYDDWGDLISTAQSADGVTRTFEQAQAYVLVADEVWLGGSQTVRTSDASIAPLVTESYTKISNMSLTNIGERFSVDVRGNTNRTWSALDPTSATRTTWTRQAGVGNLSFAETVDGETTLSVDAGCVTNRTTYDAFRRRISTTDGRGNTTTYAYDALGHLAAVTDAATNTTHYAYDAMGRVAEMTNALGNVTFTRYDARGNKTYEGGATYPVNYTYDVLGNRTTMTTYRDESSGAGDTTTWFYDEASGLVTNKVYADGMGPTYAYDASGRLTHRIWARGTVTTYSYDEWGSLTRTDYSDATPSVVLVYDVMGRQTSAIDAAGTTTFAYDAFGSLTNETVFGVAGTNVIERFTDAYGRDVGYALNGVRQSTLGYDPATGRLASMQTVGSETPFMWSYLAGSDLKSSLAYPNGLTASWTYDSRNQLLDVRNAFSTNVISQYAYTYDAAGRRIGCDKSGSAFDTSDSLAYLYNARSELTNATAAADAAYRYGYAFDDIGNREAASERGTNTAYTANALNQYTSVGRVASRPPQEETFQPQYDADGNQTIVKTTTGIWQITYNGENRPVLWTQGTNTISMSYDRMGRRVTKNDQRFVHNGYLQIANFSSSPSAFISYFVWDPTEPVATRPLAWNRGTSVAYYTHDGNKNVSEVIASDNDIVAHYEYAPFRALTVSRGVSAAANPWRFSSEYADDELGCVYYNYRHYEPVTGRWMQRDPIGEGGGLCLYCFVQNIPTGCADSLGNKSFAQYEFNPKRCELHVTMSWWIQFIEIVGGDSWTSKEKSAWRGKAKDVVEGYFNDLPLRCSKEGKCCDCKDGIKVVFTLKFVGEQVSLWDRFFGFSYNSHARIYKVADYDNSWVERNSGDVFLNGDDASKNGDGIQITIIHEVGHLLGLEHPGHYSGKRKNKAEDYKADYNGLPGEYNLMGEGMALHIDDFNRAFCDQIDYDKCDK